MPVVALDNEQIKTIIVQWAKKQLIIHQVGSHTYSRPLLLRKPQQFSHLLVPHQFAQNHRGSSSTCSRLPDIQMLRVLLSHQSLASWIQVLTWFHWVLHLSKDYNNLSFSSGTSLLWTINILNVLEVYMYICPTCMHAYSVLCPGCILPAYCTCLFLTTLLYIFKFGESNFSKVLVT